MLSKQDKLKYGQQLRRQMKQKEEKKKMDDFQKRGIIRSPTDTRIPIEPQPYFDNKQSFQNRLQSQNIDYYGRPGGGALNRQPPGQNNSGMQPQCKNLVTEDNYYDQNPMGRQKTQQQYGGYQGDGGMHLNNNYNSIQKQQVYDRQRGNDPQYYQKSIGYQQGEQLPMYVQAQQLPQQVAQQSYSNNPYAPATNLGPPQRVPTDRSYMDPNQYSDSRIQPPPQYNYVDDKNYQHMRPQYQAPPQYEAYQDPMQQINQKHQAYRQKTKQNEQLMQIHKKGGRNLLQLQNMTIDQQQIKQKQKQEMRRQLQQQMKQVQERKKQQIQRIKRQQLEQQRKNEQYILKKKRQLQEEQMKKQNKQRQLIQQNVRNLQQRKRLQQQAKQKAKRQKNRHQAPVQASVQNSPKMKQKQAFSRQSQFQLPGDQTTSQVSSSTVMEKGFNTGVSKQFFQNQRRKDQDRYNRQKNLEVVTDEIKRLKDQIDQQNHMFLRQIQKVKLQSEMAEHQKKKAEQQIQNLKMQLKRKMQQDNQRLFVALQRQQSLVQQQNDYQQPPRRNNQRKQPPQQYQYESEALKPQRDEKLVKKQYAVPQQQPRRQIYNPKLTDSNISEDGMLASLHGDSKKIPINLPEDKLSMSRLSDFARQTSFFKNDGKTPYLNSNQKKTNLRVQQSIVEEQQDRADSRVAPRKQSTHKVQKDELDKFVDRQKSRDGGGAVWGELSSVNSDITKEIEQLLKKKDNPYRPPSSTKYDNPYNRPPSGNKYDSYQPNERPSSNLSNAGRRALSRGGLQYDGASLGTINSIAGGNAGLGTVGTVGTVDIDRIHNRNEKRLNELRNMGVQTINTNGDQQFSKLDMILNKYKQSRVL